MGKKINTLRVLTIIVALLSLLIIGLSTRAFAAPPSTLFGDVGVCDPWYPQNCSAPLGRLKAGGDQYGASTAAALAPTIPSGATGILVVPVGTNNTSGQCLMWRDDGTDPTGTVGNPIAAGQPMWYYVKTSATNSAPLSALRLITATGATCAANLIYLK